MYVTKTESHGSTSIDARASKALAEALEYIMPKGKGTYGSKMGRPPAKPKPKK